MMSQRDVQRNPGAEDSVVSKHQKNSDFIICCAPFRAERAPMNRRSPEAAGSGVEIVNLPGYSPDLNPIERLWDWMREDVTRGFCHASVPELIEACQSFIER